MNKYTLSNAAWLSLLIWLTYSGSSMLIEGWETDERTLKEFLLARFNSVIWIVVFALSGIHPLIYFRRKLRGESDLEIYPPKPERVDTLALEGEQLVFDGGAKYKAILLSNIEEISYVASNDVWQEVRIKHRNSEAFMYQLKNSQEYFNSAVDEINKSLLQKNTAA